MQQALEAEMTGGFALDVIRKNAFRSTATAAHACAFRRSTVPHR
jgi:hypothetical protein